MKYSLTFRAILLAAMVAPCGISAQPSFVTYRAGAVAAMPPSTALRPGSAYVVTDGASVADCSVGGGSTIVLCMSYGSGGWHALVSGLNPGPAGAAATISVGTTTTSSPGGAASVTNSGSSSSAVFNFTIPRGVAGPQGDTGADGQAATISVGTTTTGTPAAVTNSGTSSAAVLNFVVPQGPIGPSGAAGVAGTPRTVLVNGSALAAEDGLNFVGTGLSAADNPGASRIDLTVGLPAFKNVLYVDSDPSKAAPYNTLLSAFTAVAAIAPTATQRALVIVHPGLLDATNGASYVETAPLAWPANTTVLCLGSGLSELGIQYGNCTLKLLGSSGALSTWGDRAVAVGFDIIWGTATTGAVQIITKSGTNVAGLVNSTIQILGSATDANAVDAISVTTGGFVLRNTTIQRSGAASLTRLIFSSTTTGVAMYGGRLIPGTSEAVTVETPTSPTGNVKLWYVRVGVGICDLKAGTANAIEANETPYVTTCGAGTVLNAVAHIGGGGAAPSGACSSGTLSYDNSVPPMIYLCGAGVWYKAATIP